MCWKWNSWNCKKWCPYLQLSWRWLLRSCIESEYKNFKWANKITRSLKFKISSKGFLNSLKCFVLCGLSIKSKMTHKWPQNIPWNVFAQYRQYLDVFVNVLCRFVIKFNWDSYVPLISRCGTFFIQKILVPTCFSIFNTIRVTSINFIADLVVSPIQILPKNYLQ